MMIRKLEVSDCEELFALYAHYTAEQNRPPLSSAKMSEIWREIERNPGVHYFVLELEARLAAACILSITPSFIRGGSAYGVIEHVVTHVVGHRAAPRAGQLPRFSHHLVQGFLGNGTGL